MILLSLNLLKILHSIMNFFVVHLLRLFEELVQTNSRFDLLKLLQGSKCLAAQAPSCVLLGVQFQECLCYQHLLKVKLEIQVNFMHFNLVGSIDQS